MNLATLNALDQPAFTAALGAVFEHSPWIAERTWASRPFASLTDLHAALCRTLDAASPNEQLALIQAHPDLAGRAAQHGTLTPASANEQATADLDRLSDEEQATFNRYNAIYREKFGFPFVICVRDNHKATILAGFRDRIPNSYDAEKAIALREITRIAWLRLSDMISERNDRNADS